jgi:cell division transport system permease protein
MSPRAKPASERHSILPSQTTERLPLTAAMTIMSYLAALALAAALAIGHASGIWTTNLAGAVTVQIRPVPALTQAAQSEAVLKLLKAAPGVREARLLSEAEIRHLIEPWLGKSVPLEELPIPQLVAVTLDRSAPPDLSQLGETIAKTVPGAVLDDHRRWNERLVGFTGRLTALGYAVLLLIGVATVAIVIFATRAGLAANHETVEVLHLVGAQDGFIARQFERYFLRLALRAGAIGAAAAAITLALGGLAMSGGEMFLPSLADAGLTPAAILAVPVATAFVAMATARLTVLDVLRAMP